jgi:hypothetical protein
LFAIENINLRNTTPRADMNIKSFALMISGRFVLLLLLNAGPVSVGCSLPSAATVGLVLALSAEDGVLQKPFHG